jgi:hypothetical protein
MAISVDDAYNSVYCYEQMLQSNDSANCSSAEKQSISDSQAAVQSQEAERIYNENQGSNIDITA